MSDQDQRGYASGTFAEALRRGLAAHRSAMAARREVERVLEQASREVANEIGGLRFELDHLAIAAKIPCGVSEHLADVTIGPGGFDVSVRWSDRVEVAASMADVERAVVALLESAATGKKLAVLLTWTDEVPR